MAGGRHSTQTHGPRLPRGPRSTSATAIRGRGYGASRLLRRPPTGTASAGSPTAASSATSSPGTTCVGNAIVRASGGTEDTKGASALLRLQDRVDVLVDRDRRE